MTLDDLATHHRKQSEHFATFGAENALTVFHSEAALCALAAKAESAADETVRLRAERDQWAAKWHAMRRQYAELRWPGMNKAIHVQDA